MKSTSINCDELIDSYHDIAVSEFRVHDVVSIISVHDVLNIVNYHFKLVKFQGEFVWHDHKDTDEVFIVLDGEMTIHFRDGDASVKKGEMFVIPKGVEHKTCAKSECQAMLVEAAGTVNTGDAGGGKTAPADAWI